MQTILGTFGARISKKTKNLGADQGKLLAVALLVLCLALSLSEPRFATLSNLLNILQQAALITIVAIGQFIVIIAGGLDLSIGPLIAFVSITTGVVMLAHGIIPGILAGVAVSTLTGLANGLLVAYVGVPALIATLGVGQLVRGVTFLITNAQVVFGLPMAFIHTGIGFLGPIPNVVAVAIGIGVITSLLLYRQIYGRELYAVGGNDRTSMISGLSIRRVRLKAYVLCSLITGIAAIVLTARVGTGQPEFGAGLDTQNIIAVYLAGAKFGGGEGRLVNVPLGAILMSVLTNGLNLLNVSTYLQMVVLGGMLIVVLALSGYGK